MFFDVELLVGGRRRRGLIEEKKNEMRSQNFSHHLD
jgi:hypothetical protein